MTVSQLRYFFIASLEVEFLIRIFILRQIGIVYIWIQVNLKCIIASRTCGNTESRVVCCSKCQCGMNWGYIFLTTLLDWIFLSECMYVYVCVDSSLFFRVKRGNLFLLFRLSLYTRNKIKGHTHTNTHTGFIYEHILLDIFSMSFIVKGKNESQQLVSLW